MTRYSRAGAGEGVPQVAALLVGAQIGPADVAEAERLRHRAGLVARPVVEDVGLGGPRVARDEGGDGLPGVAEHLDRLAADRQVDIDAGVGGRVPGPDARLVGGQVEAPAGEVHRQADHLVDDVGGGEHHERPQRRVVGLEPDLADDEAGRADHQPGSQVEQVAVGVGVLLVVIGGQGRDETGGARDGLRGRRRPGGGGHRPGPDRQPGPVPRPLAGASVTAPGSYTFVRPGGTR